MSDDDSVTSVQVAFLTKHLDELTTALQSIASGVSTLLQFQARQGEINNNDNNWKQLVEKHQDKQDDRIDANRADFEKWKTEEFKPVRDSQRTNSLIVNGVATVAGVAVGIVGTLIAGG